MARMSIQKQSIISILSILLYFIGFFRIEVELNNHMRRIFALEEAVRAGEKSIRNGSPEGTITLALNYLWNNSVKTPKFAFIN